MVLGDPTRTFRKQIAYEKHLDLVSLVGDDVPDGLRGDPARIRQVLTNLVGNAIKFTDSGKVIVQADTVGEHAARSLRLRIRDTGRGISAADQEKLFKAFERGSLDLSDKFAGTGLGLVITKKLVETMGGEISLVSEPGAGTTVIVLLPLVPDRNPENRYGFGRFADGRRVRISADDDLIHAALSLRLKHWGAELADARSDAELEIHAYSREALAGVLSASPAHESLPSGAAICLASSVDREELGRLAQLTGHACLPLVGRPDSLARELAAALGVSLPPAVEANEPGQQLNGLKVLVADDNRINRHFLRKMLALQGAEVLEAETGMDAVRQAAELHPHAVLLDIHMPDIDGVEAARRIRDAGLANLPLLALSANIQPETRKSALAAGINEYLLKPVSESELVEAILKWTARAESTA